MKVGIIGAGASGMMAAVTAAEYHAEVTLFEMTEWGKRYWQQETENAISEILILVWKNIIVMIRRNWKKYFPDSR